MKTIMSSKTMSGTSYRLQFVVECGQYHVLNLCGSKTRNANFLGKETHPSPFLPTGFRFFDDDRSYLKAMVPTCLKRSETDLVVSVIFP